MHLYLKDIYDVGITKSIGYLPIRTIEKICEVRLNDVLNHLNAQDIKYIIFNEQQCDVASGAIYTYSEEMYESWLLDNSKVLSEANVPTSNLIDSIKYIAKNIIHPERYPDAYVAIGRAFNDPRFN